jgi:F-type H+-transporting ATPase subunit epsilon
MMSTIRPGVIEVFETLDRSNKMFVRGGFADVSGKGLTILAEQALPLAELDAAAIDAQIKAADEDVKDASSDEARSAAELRRDQLMDLRSALNL